MSDSPTPSATLEGNFLAVAAMVAATKKETRLSEPTLVKLWELNLMWALNNRAPAGLAESGIEGIPEGLGDEILGGDTDETPTPESE